MHKKSNQRKQNSNSCSEEHGLYINSLIYGIEYEDTEIDEKLRKRLEDEIKKYGLETLYEKACKIDEKAMQNISRNDAKRIIRVIEIYEKTGRTKTEMEANSRKELEFDFKVFITSLDREKLYEKINKRVDIMIDKGLIEETENILNKYNEYPTAMQAIGYKETKEFLEKKITKEELEEKIKQETRRYAKRQITWFKRIKEATLLDMEETTEKNVRKILEVIDS